MSDYGSNVADKAVKDIERKIRQIYKQAQKELEEKLNTFLFAMQSKIKQKEKDFADGLITEQEYKNWLKGQLFMQKQWKDKLDQATRIMNTANKRAAEIVNTGKMSVFAQNYNYSAYEAEKEIGKSIFNLYNTESVAKLMKDDPQILPTWKIDEKKDYIWNYTKANNAITQGIIQGEGVDQIMDRLVNSLCSQNENKMRTFARTAVTGAQNSGRIEMMHDAIDDGIKMKKKWLATLDDRTREAHRDLDGEVKDVDDPFEVNFDGDDYKIDYPGDPKADACMVYNCRCTLTYVYEGIDQKSVRRDSEGNMIENMSYREWEKWKEENGEIKGFTASEEQDKITSEGAQPASIRYVNNQELFYKNAGKITPIDGYEDIICHGDKYGLQFNDMEGNERNVSVKEFTEMIRQNPEYHGGDIRLIVCEAGAEGSVVAQGVANELNVNVMAPSDIVWVNEDGSMTVGNKPNDRTGEWVTFKPRRNR